MVAQAKFFLELTPFFPPYRARPKPRFLDVNTQTPSRKPVLSNENPLSPNRMALHLTRFGFSSNRMHIFAPRTS